MRTRDCNPTGTARRTIGFVLLMVIGLAATTARASLLGDDVVGTLTVFDPTVSLVFAGTASVDEGVEFSGTSSGVVYEVDVGAETFTVLSSQTSAAGILTLTDLEWTDGDGLVTGLVVESENGISVSGSTFDNDGGVGTVTVNFSGSTPGPGAFTVRIETEHVPEPTIALLLGAALVAARRTPLRSRR